MQTNQQKTQLPTHLQKLLDTPEKVEKADKIMGLGKYQTKKANGVEYTVEEIDCEDLL